MSKYKYVQSCHLGRKSTFECLFGNKSDQRTAHIGGRRSSYRDEKARIPYVEKDAEEQFAALLAKLHPAWDIEISTCCDVCANEGRVEKFWFNEERR